MKHSFLSVQRLHSPLSGHNWGSAWAQVDLAMPEQKPLTGAAQMGLISGTSFTTFSTAGAWVSLWAQGDLPVLRELKVLQ